MSKPSMLTADEIVQMMDAYESGKRPAELAETYGVSTSTFNAIRRRVGIPARYGKNRVVAPGAYDEASARLNGEG